MIQSSRIKIHIAHGDPLVAAGLAVSLQKQPDFEAYLWPAGNLSSATAGDLPRPDVVIADYDSGMRLITSAAAKGYRVVILTHSDGEARIRDALEQGARGYLLLGGSLKDLFDGLRSVRAGGLAIGPQVAGRVAEWMTHRALTPREGDILRQLMLGRSNKHIALALNVAIGTVKTHVKSILDKLDATSRTQAAAIAQRRGILQEREYPSSASAVARIGARPGQQKSGRDSIPERRANMTTFSNTRAIAAAGSVAHVALVSGLKRTATAPTGSGADP